MDVQNRETAKGWLLRMWTGFPRKSEVDRAVFEREMTRDPAAIQYVMFFTPRSGSSWLTDLAYRTGRLSNPGECFNPNFMPDMTRALNATTMDEYCDILVRRRNTHGVFGFQITAHQLRAVFGTPKAFLERFPCRHCFWLIREDIVLQGVSLYKMQQTQIGHAPGVDEDTIARSDQAFTYDASEIKRWIKHIRHAEIATEALIADAGLTPFRMSYERNMAVRPARVVNVMAHQLGLEPVPKFKLGTTHSKIGTGRNEEFAERFRAEMQAFVEKLEEDRADLCRSVRVIRQRKRQDPA